MRRLALFRAVAAPPETPPQSVYGRPGVNVNRASYWSSLYPFINLIRTSDDWSSLTYVNADGWLSGLPNGVSVNLPVAFDMNSEYGHVRPGNYRVVSASGATLSLYGSNIGSGVHQVTSGVNLCTFTVDTQPNDIYSSATSRIQINVTNSTGSPINVNDLGVYHVDDRARYEDGKTFTTRFLDDKRNMAVLRPMDMVAGGVFTRTESSANLASVASRSWRAEVRGVPYAICARMYTEMRELYPTADPLLWINTPSGSNQMRYTVDAGTDVFSSFSNESPWGAIAHNFSNDSPIMFMGWNGSVPAPLARSVMYYARDVTSDQFKIAATPGGAAIDITVSVVASSSGLCVDDGTRDIAAFTDAVFAQVYAEAPGATVAAEYYNEAWNSALTPHHWIRTVLAAEAGASYNISVGYAYGSLIAWRSAERAGYARNKVKRIYAGQAANFGNLSAGFDYVDPGIIQPGAAVKALMGSGDYYAIAPYAYPQIVYGTIPPDGAYYVANGFGTKTNAEWSAAMTLGTTWAASNAAKTRTSLAAKNPAIRLTSYEAGHHFEHVGSTVGMRDVGLRFLEWFQSADGLAWAQDYRQRVCINNSLDHLVWFLPSGSWRVGDSQTVAWGMKRGTHVPDTPLSAWFNALT